jgi:hypothetical protein
MLARQYGLFEDRRVFQIVATVGVALINRGRLFLYRLTWMWHYIKRHRLRFPRPGLWHHSLISLHEVDAWNSAMPCARRSLS